MVNKIKNLLFKNTSTHQTIAKNSFWLVVGNILSRLIRVGVIVYAARVLGVIEWGAFNYALGIAGLFTVFVDFGISGVITRESSKDLSAQEKYFSSALILKIISGAIIFIGLIFLYPKISYLFGSQKEGVDIINTLMPLMALVIIFDSIRDFGAALYRAWEKMEMESFVQILTNIVIFVAGFIALKSFSSAKSLAWGYIIGTGVGMIAALYPFKHYFHNFIGNITWENIKKIIFSAWPLGILALMGSIMLNTDMVAIGWIKDIQQVGFYSAGQKIAQLIYILPALIAVAFFPSMAKKFEDKEASKKLIEKSISILSFLAWPLMIGGAILSRQIIGFVYGPLYLSGTTAFILMNLTYFPVFISASLGNAIFALNQERKLFTYSILAAFGNLILDIILIPILGIAGAALSTVLNQIIATTYLVSILKKHLNFGVWRNSIKPIIASILMGVVVFTSSALGLNILISLIIGIIAYFLFALLLREENISFAFSYLKSFASR